MKIKFSKSQLFSVFVLFLLGFGWLGLISALGGFFYKPVFLIYAAAGFGFLFYIFFSNLRLLRRIHPGFISAASSMIFSLLIFSYFSSPTIFSGRDQGSLSEAAIRLAENHQLEFSTPISEDFFKIYGPGRALNFPGFSYTDEGNLITQFPLGYVSWLAVFYSFFGLAGLIAANAISFLIFLLSFYLLLRQTLRPGRALSGILLVLTSFVFSWFFKFTLSENLALALVWFGVWAFTLFLENRRKFYLFSALLSFGFLLFVRIEALAFAAMGFALLLAFSRRRNLDLPKLLGRPLLAISATIGFLYLISLYLNREFFVVLAKALVKPEAEAGAFSFVNFFDSLSYTAKIFLAYELFAFLIIGAAGIVYFYNIRKSFLVPFLIVLPSFLYVIFPNVSGDHPWMLRRYLFAVIPVSIYYSVLFLDRMLKKKIIFYFIIFLLLAANIRLTYRYLPFIPHKQLLSAAREIAANFSDSDLVLVDQKASGDGWSMLSGPLNFLFGKQAAYFFNPKDLDKIDQGKYSGIYFVIPDSQISLYESWGLFEKIYPVENYSLTNNFLSADAAKNETAYYSPVSAPREQAASVTGKIYKLKAQGH